jgi:hypothetical protein
VENSVDSHRSVSAALKPAEFMTGISGLMILPLAEMRLQWVIAATSRVRHHGGGEVPENGNLGRSTSIYSH